MQSSHSTAPSSTRLPIQDLTVEGKPLYVRVAEEAALRWNQHGNVLLVVGATGPAELREIRTRVGDVPLLIPGVGEQGASLVDAVENGQDSAGAGILLSSSRAVLYASSSPDFAAATRQKALALRDRINGARRVRRGGS
ncbi:MAG: hypothetical protein WDO69_17340 [Pseudomonadota bacterium]